MINSIKTYLSRSNLDTIGKNRKLKGHELIHDPLKKNFIS